MTTTEAGQHKTTPAPIAFDMTDPAFVRDPYPRYAELRESPGLHRSRDGLWVLTRHADVLAALPPPRAVEQPSLRRSRPGAPRSRQLPRRHRHPADAHR